MQNNYKNFEDYLKDVHAEDYHGTDDDMSDSYEDFITNMDVDVMIAHADKFGALRARDAVVEFGEKLKIKMS